jgi:peptidoglycan hydrolase-like protein with peptidoglycan-binding domain
VAQATAKVTRQTLTDTSNQDGKLSYGDTTSVSGRVQGTVTWLPAVGQTLKRGDVLYGVDNSPVVLMYGSLPAYRNLTVDTKGADVKEFEQNLWDLGYRGFTVDETYSDATATAVKKWQKDLGLPESARTGTVDLGRVVYAPDQIRVDTLKASAGDAAQPGNAVLTYAGTSRVATVDLELSNLRLAVQGAPVTVKLPDGKTANGKITKVQTFIDTGSSGGNGGGGNGGNNNGSSAKTKVRVTVAPDDPDAFANYQEATVTVGFTASKKENVLTVPVSALLALTEGGYGVQVVDGVTSHIVRVDTGMFANGRVEVTGDGLNEGATVGVAS